MTMTQAQIESKLKRIIEEELGISADEVTRDALLVEDLGADSLDVTELVMACEEQFNIAIDDDGADRLTTFGQLLRLVTAALALRGAA